MSCKDISLAGFIGSGHIKKDCFEPCIIWMLQKEAGTEMELGVQKCH